MDMVKGSQGSAWQDGEMIGNQTAPRCSHKTPALAISELYTKQQVGK